MDYDAIKKAAEAYKDDMTKFLRDLVALPDESCEEEKVIKRIAAEMKKVGFDKVDIDPMGNVLGYMGTGETMIGFDAHIDTVGIGEIKNWNFDPYEGYENESEIGGRGTSDQEGGIVSAVYGAKIMGVSFAYLPTMLGIVQEYNLNTILGSQLIAGCIGIIIGIFIKYLRKFFPPVVTGTVIFTIGLSLFPTAVRYMAGGAGSANFSSPQNWICALLTMFLVLFFNNFTRGFTKLASILLAMIIGYVIAIPMGLVDVSSVGSARWFMNSSDARHK